MKKVLIGLGCAALLVGCGQETPAKSDALIETNYVAYATLKPEDAILVVDGEPLTKQSVESMADIQTALASIANSKLTVAQAKKMGAMIRAQASERFKLRRAMIAEAARRGIRLTEEERAEIRAQFARSILRTGKKADFKTLLGRLSEKQAKSVEQDIDLDKLYQKTADVLRKECAVTATEKEISELIKSRVDYNARAKAEEARIYHFATNTWKRLEAGEPFERAVERLKGMEHVDVDENWGVFERDYFKDDPVLYRYLGLMAKDTVTPPIPGDNGLIIVKAMGFIPPNFTEGVTTARYQLAKIFFALPEMAPVETPEEAKATVEKGRSEAAFKAKVDALVKELKVEYPNGHVVFGGK